MTPSLVAHEAEPLMTPSLVTRDAKISQQSLMRSLGDGRKFICVLWYYSRDEMRTIHCANMKLVARRLFIYAQYTTIYVSNSSH